MGAILEIATVIGCPINCAYCAQGAITKAYHGRERVMSFDTFIRCMEHTPAPTQIFFSSFAEPYLNPRCSDMVCWLWAERRKFQMFTTGFGMTPKDVTTLKLSQPDYLTIHAPANDDQMRLAVTPQYIETLRALAEYEPYEVLCFGDELARGLEFLEDRRRTIVLQSRCGNVWERQRLDGPARCNQHDWDHPTLLPDGSVTICCCDYALKGMIGNLLTNTFAEIMVGPEMQAYRAAMASDGDAPCRLCDYCQPL